MKVVVIGGTGLIGSKVVMRLREWGHEVLPASPESGVNTVTGEGLAEALAGAQVVVDVSNSPSFEDKAVLEFFTKATRNVIAAEVAAGVRHHVALSVVGTDRMQDSGYFRAKLVQENLVMAAQVPYTILRSTQFYEFVGRIAQSSSDGQAVRVSPALTQPIVSDDVAAELAEIALREPIDATIEIAGPELVRLDELVRRYLAAAGEAREVVSDLHAPYFGAELDDETLTPDDDALIGSMRFDDWLAGAVARRPVAPVSAEARVSAA